MKMKVLSKGENIFGKKKKTQLQFFFHGVQIMHLIQTSTTDTSVEITSFEWISPVTFWIGIGLSVIARIFIGTSFVLNKVALLRLSTRGKRANEGGCGYLKDWLWWAGIVSMGVGQVLNSVAYTFAPASVVSALGVVSVLVSTILSSYFLKETINFLGKIGCFLCGIGSIVIVNHAPAHQEVTDVQNLESNMTHPTFLTYVALVIVASTLLIFFVLPKFEKTSTATLITWVGICSMVGSLGVMFFKGFGLAVASTLQGQNEFTNYLTYVYLGSVMLCVAVQVNYLNKALDTFSTTIVTPICYVFFTTFVISASAILFREFANLALNDWIGLFCGFAIVSAAIFLLHFCNDSNITLANLIQEGIRTRADDGTGSRYVVVELDNMVIDPHLEKLKVDLDLHYETKELRRSSLIPDLLEVTPPYFPTTAVT